MYKTAQREMDVVKRLVVEQLCSSGQRLEWMSGKSLGAWPLLLRQQQTV